MSNIDSMTLDEFLEKYGSEKVTFSSYYKYSFIFTNETIFILIGGVADDIYGLNVDTKPITINTLNNACEIIYWGKRHGQDD